MRVEVFHLDGEALGVRQVVGVHPGQQRPASDSDARVQGVDQAAIARLTLDADALVREVVDHFETLVRRAVVDHQQLEIPEALIQYARDRVAHVGRRVVDGQKDRERRRGHPIPCDAASRTVPPRTDAPACTKTRSISGVMNRPSRSGLSSRCSWPPGLS